VALVGQHSGGLQPDRAGTHDEYVAGARGAIGCHSTRLVAHAG
jgi:hypothetical protein